MVDKDNRLKAAAVIREFMNGALTSFDLEERFPSSSDKALRAVSIMLWFFYDDLLEHRLSRLTPKEQAIFKRCILFLQTDIEYTGPMAFITPEVDKPTASATLLQRLWCWITGQPLPEGAPVAWNPASWPFASEDELRLHEQAGSSRR